MKLSVLNQATFLRITICDLLASSSWTNVVVRFDHLLKLIAGFYEAPLNPLKHLTTFTSSSFDQQVHKRFTDNVALSALSALWRWLQIYYSYASLYLFRNKLPRQSPKLTACQFASLPRADQRNTKIKDNSYMIQLPFLHGRVIAVFD